MSYQIYELKLKPLSPWISDLTADTIFGHLCWQIKYEFGKEVLEEFLKEMAIKPIFTISDFLPVEEVNKPCFDFDLLTFGNKENHEKVKHYKKIDYISEKSLAEISNLDGVNENNINDIRNYILGNNYNINKYDFGYKKSSYFDETIENKNNINRNTGTTSDNGIYSQSSKYSTREFRLLLKNISKKNLENYNINGKELNIFALIENIFNLYGFGKKKSNGKGLFEIINKFQEKSFGLEKDKYLLTLSSFIPSEKDSTKGNYKILTKFPKMGEEFSSEGQNFYKKPMIMIGEGATFEKGKNYEGYVGKMLDNSAINRENIYHYSYGFTLEF